MQRKKANTVKLEFDGNDDTAFIVAKAAHSSDDSWYIDSGAMQHINIQVDERGILVRTSYIYFT